MRNIALADRNAKHNSTSPTISPAEALLFEPRSMGPLGLRKMEQALTARR